MRRLALMGAAKGPCVSARGIRRPHLRISGLPENGVIFVKTNKGEMIAGIAANGTFLLSEEALEWVEVSCQAAKGHRTVCEIVSERAA